MCPVCTGWESSDKGEPSIGETPATFAAAAASHIATFVERKEARIRRGRSRSSGSGRRCTYSRLECLVGINGDLPGLMDVNRHWVSSPSYVLGAMDIRLNHQPRQIGKGN